MGVAIVPLLFVSGVVLATVGLSFYATRLSRTTLGSYVAGRGVNALWNSSAISGEYLSAASFMGIAGMLMKYGYDVLWYAVGYAAGYVFLLLFIAGPFRRFGAYTIPDFAAARLDSQSTRRMAVAFALAISFFYMLPQMKGAGVTLALLLGSPYWLGVVVVGVAITLNVVLGGIRGVTLVQAFQHWVKQFAIMVPVFVLFAVTGAGYGANVDAAGRLGVAGTGTPIAGIRQDTVMRYPAGGGLEFTSDGRVVATGDTPARLAPAPAPGAPRPASIAVTLEAGATFVGRRGDALTFPDGAVLTVKAGMTIPNVPSGDAWLRPFGPLTSRYGDEYSMLYTYSLLIALLCGTAGLPHVLAHFHTNPDGRETKRTTLLVIAFLSLFYIFPAMWGAMGRNLAPSLYINGATDLVTIRLPELVMTSSGSPLAGQVLSGVTSAGAFAAFMTTASGLLVSISGGLANDVYGRILRPSASSESRLFAFRIAAGAAGAVAIGSGLLVESFDINMLVGWAFAIGASTCFPLLLLGAWFRDMTKAGAMAGMLGGGVGAIGSVVFSMLVDKGLVAAPLPLVGALTAQPAVWTVPLAFGLMVVVSLATRSMVPADVRLKMLRLHAPEELGLAADRRAG